MSKNDKKLHKVTKCAKKMPTKRAKMQHYSLSQQNSIKFVKDFTPTLLAHWYFFPSLLYGEWCHIYSLFQSRLCLVLYIILTSLLVISNLCPLWQSEGWIVPNILPTSRTGEQCHIILSASMDGEACHTLSLPGLLWLAQYFHSTSYNNESFHTLSGWWIVPYVLFVSLDGE